MFCRNCGAPNDDNAVKCVQCGASLGSVVGSPSQTVPNYLVQAILTTVFCCLPFGIVAIVYAAQVNAKLAGGDLQGALESSSKAKTWTMVAFFCGLVPTLGYIVLMIVGVLSEAQPGMNH